MQNFTHLRRRALLVRPRFQYGDSAAGDGFTALVTNTAGEASPVLGKGLPHREEHRVNAVEENVQVTRRWWQRLVVSTPDDRRRRM